MANDKKFVVKNGLTAQNIEFVDQVGSANNTITVSMLSNDTLSFSGDTGQLFSITDSQSGTIFAVNDISGVPSIEVDDDGTIRFAETFGNVLIGTATDDGINKLQVDGSASFSQTLTSNNIVVTGDLTVSGNVTYIDTTTLNIGDNIITLNKDETGSPTQDAGIEVERGTATNVSLVWDESLDRWTVGAQSFETNGLNITGYGSVIDSNGQWVGDPANLQGYTGSRGFTGSQGVQGFTGSQGIQGPIGYTGSQGIQGFTGSQGVQGPIGFTGSQGDQGIQGFTGSQGVQGFTGSQGIQGPIGYTGSQGIQGETGFTGSQGIQGFTGSQGDQGIQGPQGFTGSQGDTGAQGPQGFTGSQGIQGVTGFTGSRGSIGYTGSRGVIGFTGSQGPETYAETSDTAPSSPVDGQLWWDSSIGQLLIYYDDGSGAQWVEASPSTNPFSYDSGTNTYTLSGNLTVQGDIDSTSDGRLKTNVSTIQTPINKVNELRGVNFEWRDSGKQSLGVIAQEVEKILPELVNETNEGYKTVQYANMVGLLIEAVKELNEKVDRLEKQ